MKQEIIRILTTMLPLLVAQLSTVGMTFINSAMSGHVSSADLAGVSVGAGLFFPVVASCMGVLTVGTPMIAQLLGKEETERIPFVVRTGLFLGILLSTISVLFYIGFREAIFTSLALTEDVAPIAKAYMNALIPSVYFISLVMPLRCLTDTVGSTALSMRLFLLALPVHLLFNYIFVFGHFGVPSLGGVGAGISFSLTYALLFLLFLTVVIRTDVFQGKAIFGSFLTKKADWKEYIALGVPNGLGIFMETSLFGFIIIFMAKFGTTVIAAHQAALNISTIVYMIPMSCSMAMTILVGVEVGAGRWSMARRYSRLGFLLTMSCAVITVCLTVIFRKEAGAIFSNDPGVLAAVSVFLLYSACWQFFDAIAAPVQGILRGYKDTAIPFVFMMIAYWGICMPLGLFLDFIWDLGPTSYWTGLVFGVCTTALLLAGRLFFMEKRFQKRSEEK